MTNTITLTPVKANINYTTEELSSDLFNMWYEYTDVSGNTLKTYTKGLQNFAQYLADREISKPTFLDIKAYKEYLVESGKAPSTINLRLTAVKNFFAFTEEYGLYPNIASKVKGFKAIGKHGFKRDFLNQEERTELSRSIDLTSIEGLRNMAIILLMLECGLRTVEISRANIKDLTRRNSHEVLLIQGKGHFEKDREVKLPSKIRKIINLYLEARFQGEAIDKNAPLFISLSNRKGKDPQMTTDSISRIARKQLKAIGINRPHEVTAHSLRHTCAVTALEEGQTIEQVQSLLGHKNTSTTRLYTHQMERANNNTEEVIENAILSWLDI